MASAMQRLPSLVPNSLEHTLIVPFVRFRRNDREPQISMLFRVWSMLQIDLLSFHQKMKRAVKLVQ